jgi:hypothetical protein
VGFDESGTSEIETTLDDASTGQGSGSMSER